MAFAGSDFPFTISHQAAGVAYTSVESSAFAFSCAARLPTPPSLDFLTGHFKHVDGSRFVLNGRTLPNHRATRIKAKRLRETVARR